MCELDNGLFKAKACADNKSITIHTYRFDWTWIFKTIWCQSQQETSKLRITQLASDFSFWPAMGKLRDALSYRLSKNMQISRLRNKKAKTKPVVDSELWNILAEKSS